MPQDQDSKRFIDFHGPWSGIVGDLPSVLLQNQDLVQAQNCTFKDGFLASRPLLVTKSANPFGVNSGVLGYAPNIGPFAIISQNFWFYNTGSLTWQQPLGGSGILLDPYYGSTYVTYRGILYFGFHAGASTQFFTYDGSTFNTVNNQVMGIFWTTLADHVLVMNGQSGYSGANTSVRTVWWSGSGNPTVYNPATDLTAGNTQLNVEMINGVTNNGRVVHLWHPRGIVEMAPTGNGAAPFVFNDVVYASRDGIGLWYPASLADWGGVRCWVSKDDIYLWSAASGMIPISGRSYNNIFADVAKYLTYTTIETTYLPFGATQFPQISGSIVPFYSHNYVYPVYILSIPTSNTTTSLWIYSIKNNVWENAIISGKLGEPGVIDGPFLTFNIDRNDEKCYTLGRSAFTATAQNMYVMDGSNTNCPANVIQMKDEDTHGQFRTYDRIRLLYNDKGAAQLTFTITGFNEDGTAASSSSMLNGVPGPITIGGISPGDDLQILIDMQSITCLVPTLNITSADGAGAFAIEQIEILVSGTDAETENI